MSGLRAWLDGTPIASVAVSLLQGATGRSEPVAAVRPARALGLPAGTRVAFWSLVAGVGTSTVAALVAQRSAAGRSPALLVDLDRWAPSLALRANLEVATVADALLRPGREESLISHWSAVPFLAGSPTLHAGFEGARIAQLVERAAAGRPTVLDLGSGADALDPEITASLDHLFICSGQRSAQLQAAFCSVALLRDLHCPVSLVMVGAAEADAARIASRLPWPLAAVIPFDEHLAGDAFAARAPTMRAMDQLIRTLE